MHRLRQQSLARSGLTHEQNRGRAVTDLLEQLLDVQHLARLGDDALEPGAGLELAAQRHDFNPVRLFPEGVLEWRCDALGASFRWLSKAFVAGVNAPLSRRELRALEALPSDEEWGCFTDWNGRC